MAMERSREWLGKELIIRWLGIQTMERRIEQAIQKEQNFLVRIYEKVLRKRKQDYLEIVEQLREIYEDKQVQDRIDDRM